MKVLQVNSSDVIGGRFNGFEIRGLLADKGITSHHLVWNKISKEGCVEPFFPFAGQSSGNIRPKSRGTLVVDPLTPPDSSLSRFRCTANFEKPTWFTITLSMTAISAYPRYHGSVD